MNLVGRSVLAYFTRREHAERARSALRQEGFDTVQLDRIGTYGGQSSQTLHNPLTGGVESLADSERRRRHRWRRRGRSPGGGHGRVGPGRRPGAGTRRSRPAWNTPPGSSPSSRAKISRQPCRPNFRGRGRHRATSASPDHRRRRRVTAGARSAAGLPYARRNVAFLQRQARLAPTALATRDSRRTPPCPAPQTRRPAGPDHDTPAESFDREASGLQQLGGRERATAPWRF